MWLLTLRRLKSKKAKTRLAALEKLVGKEGPKAIPHLLSALEDPEFEIRKIVAKALGKRRDPRAVAPLGKRLSDHHPEVRMAAADALKILGDKQSIPALIQAIADGHEGVRSSAASALQALGWAPADDWQRALLAVALGRLEDAARYQSAAVEPLLTVLRTGGHYKRLEAVEALSKIADAKVIPALTGALHDEDPGVRARAVNVLGKIGDARSAGPVIAALNDPKSVVREAAVEALSRLGDSRALKHLVAMLQDMTPEIRKTAAEALGKMENAVAVEPLLPVLRDPDKDVRQATAMALGKIGDSRALQHLILRLTDKEESVRQTAEFALRKIDPYWENSESARQSIPFVEAVLRNEDYRIRQAATALLKRLAGEAVPTPEPEATGLADRLNNKKRKPPQILTKERREATRILTKTLSDADPDLRLAAAEALGRIGSNLTIVLNQLVRKLHDKDTWVRRSAAKALDSLQWTPSDETESADYYIASRAWPQLTSLGEAAVEPLMATLEDSDWKTRRHAAETLGQLKDRRAQEPLAACLADPHLSVRKTAAHALLALEPLDLDEAHLKLLEEVLRN